MKYYPINEEAARRAKNANSWSDYVEGSKTREYQAYVDDAYEIAEDAKKRVEPEYHEKIDYYVDLYARRLADNMNAASEIDASYPSVMIAGGSNFSAAKKEKQNARRDKNMQEWNEIQGLLEKIRSIGRGGIRSDDANAIERLEKKLASLQEEQEKMKLINAYYRKHKTVEGCPGLAPEQVAEIKLQMASGWRVDEKPFPTWALSNNNANIHRVMERIETLKKEAEKAANNEFVEEDHNGYILREKSGIGRIQLVFDGKPDADTRALLKSNGFRWAPSEGAWQRMLNDNGRRAARTVIEKLEADA